jgi:hypothetical protein
LSPCFAFVEDEVDHFEHGGQTGGELGAAGNFEEDMGLGEGALGADDALGDGRGGDEEGPRDLLGRQAAEQPQRERDARLGGEHGMAGREHEAQKIVADVVIDRGIEIGSGHFLLNVDLTAELLVFLFEPFAATEEIDRSMLGGGHEPSARVVRDA